MKRKLTEILVLPMSERSGVVRGLKGDEADEFCAAVAVLGKEKGYKLGLFGKSDAVVNRLPVAIKKQAAVAILKQFPDIAHDSIALDRKFDNQEDRLNAIIDDLNANRIPGHRVHELLHENFYENEDGVVKYITFLTYVFAKLNNKRNPKVFNDLRKQLGVDVLESYMKLANQNGIGDSTLDIFATYLEDHGVKNAEERSKIRKKDKRYLSKYQPREDRKKSRQYR